MKTEKVITIKGKKRAGGRRRGPLPIVPGNPNVDRRRTRPADVRPVWLWDAGINLLADGSTTILFPNVGTVGSLRGPWWRKNGDVLILSLYTTGTPTISGDWVEMPASPFSTLGGNVYVYYREWQTGDPETLTVSSDEDMQGIFQAWRNVDIEDLFATFATSAQSTNVIAMPSITIRKDSAVFGMIVQEPLPSTEDENIIDAQSSRLEYVARYWDAPFTNVPVNFGVVSGSVPRPTAVNDLQVTTLEPLPSFAFTAEMPAIKPSRALVSGNTITTYIKPYYPNGLSFGQPILNNGDVLMTIIGTGENQSAFSGWNILPLNVEYFGFPVFVATKTVTDVTATFPRIDLVLKKVGLVPSIVSVGTGASNSALVSAADVKDGELVVGIGLANASFFPEAQAQNLSEFSTEKGVNSLIVVTGYGNGGPAQIAFPMNQSSEWTTAMLRFRKR